MSTPDYSIRSVQIIELPNRHYELTMVTRGMKDGEEFRRQRQLLPNTFIGAVKIATEFMEK